MSCDGQPNEDWMIFGLDEDTKIIPTALGIRNNGYDWSIKHISISIGVDGAEFEEMIGIQDIEKNDVELQVFPLDMVSSYFS